MLMLPLRLGDCERCCSCCCACTAPLRPSTSLVNRECMRLSLDRKWADEVGTKSADAAAAAGQLTAVKACNQAAAPSFHIKYADMCEAIKVHVSISL